MSMKEAYEWNAIELFVVACIIGYWIILEKHLHRHTELHNKKNG